MLLPVVLLPGCADDDIEYVRATFEGRPVRWNGQRVALYVQAPDRSSAITHAALLEATENALRAWNRECRTLHVEVRPTQARAAATRDGLNVVVLREDRWCPPEARSKGECYDERLQAVTHLRKRRGGNEFAAIEEADIELNGVHHQFSPQALRETMLHEVGHWLGLAHGCTMARFREPSAEFKAPPCTERTKLVMHPDPRARVGLDTPPPGELRFVCDAYGQRNGWWSRAGSWLWTFAMLCVAPIVWLGRRTRRSLPTGRKS